MNQLYAIFSRSNDFVADAIMAFTSREIPPAERVNHAALFASREEGPVVLGANADGVNWDALEKFTADRVIVGVFAPRDSARSLWPGLAKLRADLNERYDFSGLVGMAEVELARAIFHRVGCNRLDDKSRVFCSEFSTEVIRAAGFSLLEGIPASAIDPQEEMEALIAHPDFVRLPGVPH